MYMNTFKWLYQVPAGSENLSYLTDAVGKSLFKDELQDWSYFLVNSLVVSLTGPKVSQLISSSHFEYSMTCGFIL